MKTRYSNNKNLPVRTLTNALLGILMLFAWQAKAQTYCNTSISSPQYEHITNVTFAGINNSTGNGSSVPGNYTALTATVLPGMSYNISVSGGASGTFPEFYKVWIDWNQNGNLNDAGEYNYVGYNPNLPATMVLSIAVPPNALSGVTRMRVMMAGNASGNYTDPVGTNPCGGSAYGETEDYSVRVEGPCSGVTTPTLSLATATTVCQGLPANINISGTTPSLGVTYQWQQSAIPAGPYTPAGPSSSVLAAQTSTIASGTTYYILVATCSSSLATVTATSNAVALTGSAVPVTPTISALPMGSCVGNTISLGAQSSAGATYTWYGPNGFTSALQNPSVNNAQVAATGVYSVVANQYNCSSPAAVVSVTVSANPTAVIQASQPQYCSGGAPLTLTVNTNGTSYGWNTGATTQTASVSPSSTMVYSVGVQNAFGCYTQAVYTVSVINATLSVSGAWSCNNGAGGSGVLTAQAFTPSTVYWYASATATTPLASAAANTLGIATFSINNSYADSTVYVKAQYGVCPSLLLPVTLTVSPQPSVSLVSSPTLNTSAPTITVCSNDTYTFTALGAATYTWSNGQTTAVTNSLVIVPATFTFYANTNNYTISATSASGCTGGTMVSLYVNPSPVVSAATFTSSICPGDNVTLFAFGNANTYTWSANANNSNAPTVVVSPVQSDVYTVTGMAVNGCKTAASQSITVNAPPTLTITSQRPKICAGETVSLTASGAVTYTWVSNNFELQGASAYLSPDVTTIYQVTGTGANGCVSTATLQQVVSICTGIQQVSENSDQLKVYPNPNNGEFTVELSNGAEKTMELIDMAGRVVMTGTSGDDTAVINISQFSNGVYYLKVKSNNTVEVIKVVKQ